MSACSFQGWQGAVRDAETGQPVTDAVISVDTQRVTVDESGNFRIKLAPGEHRATVRAASYREHTLLLSIAANPGPLDQDVLLEPYTISGLLIDDRSGDPITGATISYANADANAPASVSASASVASNADGRFRIERWPSQPLTVTCPGWHDIVLDPAQIAGSSGETLTVELTARVLTGTVTEVGTGVPLKDVAISVGARETRSDSEGRYTLEQVVLGEPVHFSHPGYKDYQLDAYDGSAQDAALEPWTLAISVTDQASGEVLEGVLAVSDQASRETNAQGRALLHAALDRPITVSLSGYCTETLPYDGRDSWQVALRPSRLIGYLVASDSEEPVSPGTVQAFTPDSEDPRLLRVDETGRFEMEDAADVSHLWIKAPGYVRVSVPITRMGRIDISLEPFEVRGIYIPFGLLTLPERVEELLDLVSNSEELNAIVVDVKGDYARIAWASDLPLAQEAGAYQQDVMDLEELLAECERRDIYVIARIVVFKDTVLARQRPDLAIQLSGGGIYQDNEGSHWMDPYEQEVRDYNVGLALEVAEMGFDEVQFDYLRFPSWGSMSQRVYDQECTFETRVQAMETFCAQAYEALSRTPAFVSADIFGLTVWVDPARDMGIGQRVDDIAPHMDYLSPMLYPQTFGPGNLDFDNPELYPYEVVYHSVVKAQERTNVPVRPWLQHYSISITYGVDELLRQKRGAGDAGSCGWLYWNAGGKYREEIFAPDAYSLLTEIPTPPPKDAD